MEEQDYWDDLQPEVFEPKVRFELARLDITDGELVTVGPTPAIRHPQLRVPLTTAWAVDYLTMDVKLELHLAFSGQKFEVSKLIASGKDGHFLQSRDLTQLALPLVIERIAARVIPDFEYWTQEFQDRVTDWHEIKADNEFLAQMIWVQQITHGNPRKAIMEYFKIPRSSATVLIRRIRSEFPTPDFK